MSPKKGILIVFEGIDGAGKSTQARLLLKKLRKLGYVAVSFREPTGGRWGREIKRLAKRPDSLSPEEELSLFVKDREENVRRNLRPALARGEIIVLDRYYYSTIAYQGAKGIDPVLIRRLNERFAVRPDLMFILDIRAADGLRRIHHRKRKDLLFERERYLRGVGRIFRRLEGRGFVHLDAGRPKDELHAQVLARVLPLLRGRSPRCHPISF